jgi:hypothetical protein
MTLPPGEFEGKGAVPAKAAGKAVQAAPLPGQNAEPQTKERLTAPPKPAGAGATPTSEKPVKLEQPSAGAPKTPEKLPVDLKPIVPAQAPGVERPVKPTAPKPPVRVLRLKLRSRSKLRSRAPGQKVSRGRRPKSVSRRTRARPRLKPNQMFAPGADDAANCGLN